MTKEVTFVLIVQV